MFHKSLSYSGTCFRIIALISIVITIFYTEHSARNGINPSQNRKNGAQVVWWCVIRCGTEGRAPPPELPKFTYSITEVLNQNMICGEIPRLKYGPWMGEIEAFINIDYMDYIPCKNTGVSYNGGKEDPHFRRRIAEELIEISTQITALNKAPTAAITLKLNDIIGQLDPRYKYSSLDLKLYSSIEVEDNADTCSEVYLGRRHGHPYYQQGFSVSPSCPQFKRTRPISELVTILIFLKNSTHLERTLSGLKEYDSNFTLLIAAKKGEKLVKLSSYFKHLRVISVSKTDFDVEGKVWNMLVSHIKTPYALIAKDLTHYTKYSYLERLVHALSNSSAIGVAAGAFRNLTGHWDQSCQQSEIKNYFLRITRGYIHSAEDCMFCDHVSGPFVAKTMVLKQIPFNNELPSQIVFYDWFLELKDFGILTVTCPDIMFFTQGENVPSRAKWFALAKKRQISRIFIAPDKQIMFTCKELSLSCDPWKWADHYLLPTCCFEQIAEGLRLLPLFPNTTGLTYELDSGSQLAAVKLQGYSPWDLDGDIQYNKKYYEIFKSQKNIKSSIGTNFDTFNDKSKKFQLNTPEVYIEMWSMDFLSSSQYLPKDLQEIPTIMEVQGVWVPGQANPGLYARNKYGPHHLKHALFYSFNGHGEWDAYKTAGSWPDCPKNHHACVNRYPADGSVHFVPHYFENLGLSWDSIEGGHKKQNWIMKN